MGGKDCPQCYIRTSHDVPIWRRQTCIFVSTDISLMQASSARQKRRTVQTAVYLGFLSNLIYVVWNWNEMIWVFIVLRPEVYTITGCWVNQATGEWTIGFFENFAAYQCRFWDYESIQIKKDENRRQTKQYNPIFLKHKEQALATLHSEKIIHKNISSVTANIYRTTR